jgi:hypothetical protein
MSESSALDAAILAALGDATLVALCPDGAWWQAAPEGATRFVIVSLPTTEDVYEQGREAYEKPTYLVKAVRKETTTANVDAAAARIRTVLEALTTATGYHLMQVQRVERVKYADPDPADAAVQWQHSGGLYEVLAEPV